jgi:hypothetical protein
MIQIAARIESQTCRIWPVLFSTKRFVLISFAFLIVCAVSTDCKAQGDLQTIRDDVRGLSPASAGSSQNQSPPPADAGSQTHEKACGRQSDPSSQQTIDNYKEQTYPYFLLGAGYAVIAPYWVPRMCLRDDSSMKGLFARYPYQYDTGYMLHEPKPMPPVVAADQMAGNNFAKNLPPDELNIYQQNGNPPEPSAANANPNVPEYMNQPPLPFQKTWAAQVQVDYFDNFDRLNGVSGNLIFETASRWGVKVSAHAFHEDLPNDRFDRLTIGDANIVYRFAQHPRGQMRMGIGLNWLNDPRQTDLGFNFTYGGDFFPCKPLVISAEIDGGTIGRAGLFRFRTTTGVIWRSLETYVGYEYSDIGSTQNNFFISGVRVWF